MDTDHVVVECHDCDLREAFAKLGPARLALDDHESESGHTADWQINRVDAGVEQAGSDAGICGDTECANSDSPLSDWQPTGDESRR